MLFGGWKTYFRMSQVVNSKILGFNKEPKNCGTTKQFIPEKRSNGWEWNINEHFWRGHHIFNHGWCSIFIRYFLGFNMLYNLNPFFQAFGHRCLRSKEALHFQIWLQPSLSPKRRNIHKTSRSAVRRRSVVFSHFCWGLNYLNSPWVPSGRGWSSTQ